VADELLRSPLHDRHRALGAKLAPFAGWEMPIDYGSTVAEHTAVRSDVGVFDLSHLGSVSVTGSEAPAALQRALSNDIERLGEGGAQYTLCLTDDGGIVDDLIVYALPWGYWTVPNAANNAAVVAALRRAADGRDAEVADHGRAITCLAVQGPRSPEALLEVGIDTGNLAFMGCRPLKLGDPTGENPGAAAGGGVGPGAEPILARTGYTGERGYELFLPAAHAPPLWDGVVGAGAQPVGLGARDTLRLEMGLPLHGNDLTTETNPVAARLMWAVKLGTGFVGEEAVAAIKERGVPRRLRGVRATGRRIPRAHCEVRRDGEPVGELTSGGYSPTLETGIGMGYLSAEPGEAVEIDVRGRPLPGEVVNPPFVDRSPKA
jgi:aminomethyltransferase